MKPIKDYLKPFILLSEMTPRPKPTPKRYKVFLSYGLQAVIGIMAIASIPQFWEFSTNILQSEENKRIEEYKNEFHKIKYMDSIINIERQHFTERSFIDQKLILEELKKTINTLTDVHHITIFKAHDGGQPISTSSFKYITVMYSVSTLDNVDILMDYQKRPISTGNSWVVSTAISNGYLYVPNVDTSNQFTGLAKDYCNSIGVQSFITFYIKSLNSSYFVSIGFKDINPVNYNKNLVIRGLNLKERIKHLIYETPNHLKTYKYEF